MIHSHVTCKIPQSLKTLKMIKNKINLNQRHPNAFISESKLEYNRDECKRDWKRRWSAVNDEQKEIFTEVTQCVSQNNLNDSYFFLDAPA